MKHWQSIRVQTNRVRVIWKILYPAMKEANLVRLCLPEPPTPTSRALPLSVRMMREIWIRDQHVNKESYTLLKYLYCQPQILSPIGSSDHNCILWSPKSASVKRNNKTMTRVIRPMRASDIQRFGDCFSHDDWAEVLTDDNAQSACDTFYERVTSHMNRCFPSKKVKIPIVTNLG